MTGRPLGMRNQKEHRMGSHTFRTITMTLEAAEAIEGENERDMIINADPGSFIEAVMEYVMLGADEQLRRRVIEGARNWQHELMRSELERAFRGIATNDSEPSA